MECFKALLVASGAAAPGRTIVDFGSGSGNLTLALAFLFPACRWVAVDYNPTAVDLLRQRAEGGGLANVTAVCSTIEEVGVTRVLIRLFKQWVRALHFSGSSMRSQTKIAYITKDA